MLRRMAGLAAVGLGQDEPALASAARKPLTAWDALPTIRQLPPSPTMLLVSAAARLPASGVSRARAINLLLTYIVRSHTQYAGQMFKHR